MRLTTPVTLVLFIFAGCAAPQDRQSDTTASSKPDSNPPARTTRAAGEREQGFLKTIDELIPAMAAEKIEDREESQLRFERLCLSAGRPGAEDERSALCTAIAARLGPSTPKPARVWMLRKLETISGVESVEALAACLTDGDIEVRDAARRALSANPTAEALNALTSALQSATTDADRVALVQALGWREAVAFPVLEPFAKSSNLQVRLAAIDALTRNFTRPAIGPMMNAFAEGDAALRRQAAAAILRHMDALLRIENVPEALNDYKFMVNGPTDPLARLALYRIKVLLDGPRAIHDLIRFMNSQNPIDQRRQASGLLDEFPDPEVTRILCDAVPKVKNEAQAMLLNVLARRSDPLARVPALIAVESDDESVRLASIRVFGAVGSEADVAMLAKFAAGEAREEAATARTALAAVRGAGVDAEIVNRLDDSPVASKIELIRALAARGAKNGVAVFLQQTDADDADVRVAAFEALASRAEPGDVPQLLAALVKTADGPVRDAAESAVVAACQKIADKEERAAEVLRQMGSAADSDLASYIRMLGRLEGRAALQTIRATAEEDPPVNVAAYAMAIRALCNWSTPEVIPDLARIGKETDSDSLRTLAIRGFSRLIRIAADVGPEERFQMIRGLMDRASSTEEYRLLLGALGTARVSDALPLAERYLASPDTANEAALAVISIVKGTSTLSAKTGRDSVRSLLDKKLSESVQKSAEGALKTLDEFQGYLRDWQLCGPYAVKDKSSADLANMTLPPEGGEPVANMTGPAQPEWKPATTFRDDNPWIVNLKAIDGGTERCMYARAVLNSNTERKAKLLIGSDDGVVVWLNGERIHAKTGTRGLTVGEDKVNVTLKAGENVLLLKVLQGNGEWGFCVGLQSAEGEPLDLDRKAE